MIWALLRPTIFGSLSARILLDSLERATPQPLPDAQRILYLSWSFPLELSCIWGKIRHQIVAEAQGRLCCDLAKASVQSDRRGRQSG